MNTTRYNKYYLKGAEELINKAVNSVQPTEYYLPLAGLFPQSAQPAEDAPLEKSAPPVAGQSAASKKFHMLLYRAHTVVAQEDGVVVGLASMDKDGYLGLLCVSGDNFKKTAKLLVRALERQAANKQVQTISVVPEESTKKIFKECGYIPQEGAGKGIESEVQTPLYKTVTEKKPDIEFLPENVKRFTLDGTKPITVEGKVSAFPAIFFGIASFFILILTALTIASKTGGNVTGSENIPLFAVIFGVLFAVALGIFIAYIVRGQSIKKQVLSMTVTNAVITAVTSDTYWVRESDGDSDRYVRVYLYYEYYDENMRLCNGRFTCKYQNRAPYFYEGQELVVACAGEFNYILGKYTVLSTEGGGSKEPVAEEVSEEQEKQTKSKVVADPQSYVPVADRKIYFIVSGVVFGMLALVVGVLLLFGYLASVQVSRSFWAEIKFSLPFIAFAVVILGGIASIYISKPLKARAKYKKILNGNVKFADGKLQCADKTYKSDNRNRFYCEYRTDDGEAKRIAVETIHVAEMVKHGNTKVTVAYDGTDEIILVKKFN